MGRRRERREIKKRGEKLVVNLLLMPRRPKEEDSQEVAPTVLAHTSPTVVSAAVTALLKITVGHFVVPYSFAIWEN